MTQQEAQDLITILKRRKGEEKTSIENEYNAEHHRTDADRNHAMRRIEERIYQARMAVVKAKEDKANNRNQEKWPEYARAYEAKRAILVETQRELTEMNVYYQGVFRDLRNKRDYKLRRLAQEYGKEYADIMSKVNRPKTEETVSYWRHMYHAVAEELRQLKESKVA